MAAQPASRPAPDLHHPRWGHQTSLWQIRQPAFWLFMVFLAGAGVLAILEQVLFTQLSLAGWALSWLLMVLYAVPLIILILALDLYEREPISLMVGAFVWGAVVATTLSGIANSAWMTVIRGLATVDFADRWEAALIAPPVEEVLKGVGVVLIYLIARREIDDIMDGFVFGALVGLGFAVTEDVFYFMAVFGGEVGDVMRGFFVRVIASGLYGHVLYTGLVGIGVAYFVSRRAEATFGRRLAVAVGLFLLAMFGHFIWNSPLLDFFPRQLESPGDYLQVIAGTAVKGLPLLGVALVMIAVARQREHRWLRVALQSEVGRGGITDPELAVLESPRARRAVRRDARVRGGPVVAGVVKGLHKEQINLAMIATRTHQADHPDTVRQREYCRSLRDWLAQALPSPQAPPAPQQPAVGPPQPGHPGGQTPQGPVSGPWPPPDAGGDRPPPGPQPPPAGPQQPPGGPQQSGG